MSDTVATATDAPDATASAAPLTTANLADALRQALAQAPAAAPAAPTDGPVPVAAAGGAAVTAEPAIYTFDGSGPSLIRDALAVKDRGDSEAAERMARFNAALSDGNASQGMALAAVITRTGTDPLIDPATSRTGLLVNPVDRGRPLVSRVGVRVTLTDATPFLVPVVGDFDGVGTHTEGTAHVAEGTQALSEKTVTPKAKSGAARVSREAIDASNPAIDQIIVREMLKDYQRETEAEVWAAIAAAVTAKTNDINTVLEVRQQLIAFANANNGQPADFVAASGTYFSTLASDVDTTGRTHLPFVGPMNALGTVKAGYTGASIDGTEIATAYSVPTTEAVIVRADALLFGEGRLQTFRFEEVEGPGVIKFALWGYTAAQVLDTAGVVRVQSDAV